MRPGTFTIARLGIGAAVATGFAIWRRHRREAAERADIEQFAKMIATIPEEQLAKLHTNLQTLASFDANRQFGLKRDACQAEMDRRAAQA